MINFRKKIRIESNSEERPAGDASIKETPESSGPDEDNDLADRIKKKSRGRPKKSNEIVVNIYLFLLFLARSTSIFNPFYLIFYPFESIFLNLFLEILGIFKVLAKLQPIWSYSVLMLQRSLIQPKKVVYYNSLWQETFEILTLGPSFITSALFLAFLEPTHLKYDIRFFENSPTYFFVHIKVYLRFAHRTDHMHIAHALCRLFFCFMIFVAAVNQKVYFFIFILFMLKSAFCLLYNLE